ncbi:Inactive peptidyl-prolyl cis-trans isomerase FKBP6 [Halotydeus destructor]|nr:Inactive peptidyl-prolyl cis-trans isomerase FKBP6 [Halotydeus destructor]
MSYQHNKKELRKPKPNNDDDSSEAEASDDDINQYLPDLPKPMQLGAQTLNMDKLLQGTEFEVKDETTDREREELEELNEENQVWWNKDEILKFIEQNDNSAHDEDIADIIDQYPTLYEAMMTKMEVIYRDPETQEPLVYKRILRPGRGEELTPNCAAKYHATAYLEGQDEPFDCSRIRNQEHIHKLNQDPIVRGLYVGLLTMRKGEKSRLIVKPEMAFGKLGCQPRIPAEATILYVVEVLKTFSESSLSSFEMMSLEERQRMPFEELLKICDDERKSGNGYANEKRPKEARIRYNRAISILEDRMVANSEEEAKVKDVLVKLYYNSAIVLNEIGKHYAAISFCKKALQLEPNSTRALFQYGKGAFHSGDYASCKKYLMKAKSLKPNDTSIATYLAKLERRLQEDNVVSSALYKKMGSMFQ